MSSRVVIVTGAGSGIGQATARAFAEAGDRVVVADYDRVAARATADELRGAGSEAREVTLDVSDHDQVRAMVAATIEAFGGLDVLVNNTGFGIAADVVETTEADLDRILAVNAKGVFCGCQEAIPAMLAGGGGIIVSAAGIAGCRSLPADRSSRHQSSAWRRPMPLTVLRASTLRLHPWPLERAPLISVCRAACASRLSHRRLERAGRGRPRGCKTLCAK